MSYQIFDSLDHEMVYPVSDIFCYGIQHIQEFQELMGCLILG